MDQRSRADPLAHADRAPALLPGPSLDARLRRGVLRLQAADRYQDDRLDHRREGERQPAGGAELPHAAPEMGHPLELHREPDRKSVGKGKSGPVSVDMGGRRLIKKKKKIIAEQNIKQK